MTVFAASPSTARPLDTNRLTKCRRANGLPKSTLRYHIDRPAAQRFQPSFESGQVHQRTSRLQSHEEVHIAIRTIIASRHGAKNAQVMCTAGLRGLKNHLTHRVDSVS